jgi:hypothetical protein
MKMVSPTAFSPIAPIGCLADSLLQNLNQSNEMNCCGAASYAPKKRRLTIAAEFAVAWRRARKEGKWGNGAELPFKKRVLPRRSQMESIAF